MWILDRCEGKADAVETPIGFEPKAEDINIEGLGDISVETVKGLLDVDKTSGKRKRTGSRSSTRPSATDYPRSCMTSSTPSRRT